MMTHSARCEQKLLKSFTLSGVGGLNTLLPATLFSFISSVWFQLSQHSSAINRFSAGDILRIPLWCFFHICIQLFFWAQLLPSDVYRTGARGWSILPAQFRISKGYRATAWQITSPVNLTQYIFCGWTNNDVSILENLTSSFIYLSCCVSKQSIEGKDREYTLHTYTVGFHIPTGTIHCLQLTKTCMFWNYGRKPE